MRSSRGVSLVELLVGVTTAGIVGILLVSLLTQNSRIYTDQNAKITDGITLNNAAQKIEELLKSSSGITTQYVSGSQTFVTSQNTLVLTQPSINANGELIENVNDYIVLSADSQNSKILRFYLFPNAQSSRTAQNQVLATNLSKLEFSYLNSLGQSVAASQATRIRYLINVNQVISTKNETSSASGTVNFRNN